MKKEIKEICTELNDGKIAVVQATEKLLDLFSVSTRTYSQDEVNNLLEAIATKFDNRKLYGTNVGGREWYANKVRDFKK